MSDVDVEVKSNKKAVEKALEEKLVVIFEALGIQMAGNAMDEINALVYDQPESPNYVRTGRLKNSIAWATSEKNGTIERPMRSEDSTPKATPGKYDVVIGTNVEYAPAVEYGSMTHKESRPFLRNGISKYVNEYKRILEEGLK